MIVELPESPARGGDGEWGKQDRGGDQPGNLQLQLEIDRIPCPARIEPGAGNIDQGEGEMGEHYDRDDPGSLPRDEQRRDAGKAGTGNQRRHGERDEAGPIAGRGQEAQQAGVQAHRQQQDGERRQQQKDKGERRGQVPPPPARQDGEQETRHQQQSGAEDRAAAAERLPGEDQRDDGAPPLPQRHYRGRFAPRPEAQTQRGHDRREARADRIGRNGKGERLQGAPRGKAKQSGGGQHGQPKQEMTQREPGAPLAFVQRRRCHRTLLGQAREPPLH